MLSSSHCFHHLSIDNAILHSFLHITFLMNSKHKYVCYKMVVDELSIAKRRYATAQDIMAIQCTQQRRLRKSSAIKIQKDR